eukprot:Protomagalhaensia_wolfi_Nauph_80__3305@NODE_3362_length_816_cov_6_498069_g2638_i0_p1_GENE_NODE_3362_length_816_cov_6_498069_g2638_i0NODE_3362_length_816_cov_6_498069_g2638_i0_p1_ORF_typecomplete_len100_score19_95_NODE_3362_length_816_cov_6_498069_g2638_i034333
MSAYCEKADITRHEYAPLKVTLIPVRTHQGPNSDNPFFPLGHSPRIESRLSDGMSPMTSSRVGVNGFGAFGSGNMKPPQPAEGQYRERFMAVTITESKR